MLLFLLQKLEGTNFVYNPLIRLGILRSLTTIASIPHELFYFRNVILQPAAAAAMSNYLSFPGLKQDYMETKSV